jgi:ferric-dicitrate binding protein FerR (iron transport regulator)
MGTSSDKAEILALLKKYRAGRCTLEETIRIEEWYAQFGDDLPDSAALTAAADEAVQNVMKVITPKRYALKYALLAAAASVLIVATGLLFLYQYYHTPAPVTFSMISTVKGEKKKLTLPDGTTLTMNAGSVVRIPSDFGEHTREIYLTGQGAFDVRSDVKKPFIVHTGEVQTVVLGTAFDIKAYPEESILQVAVLNGKVRVEREKEVLAAGVEHNQLLLYNAGTAQHELKHCHTDEITGWQQNRLFFEQATIPEIALVLSRQYNINVTFSANVKSYCRYTLQLDNEPLNSALELLSQLSGITYQINNNDIKLNIASCE